TGECQGKHAWLVDDVDAEYMGQRSRRQILVRRTQWGPIAAPTTPMPAASASTVRNAKRREEPIARMTPSSRLRSTTDNISVFSRATLATKTTIHAMMSMSAVPWAIDAPTALAASWPVYTSTSSGNAKQFGCPLPVRFDHDRLPDTVCDPR